MLDLILKKFKEPTTWAGLTSLLTAAGVVISPELSGAIATLGMSVAGLLLVIFDEKNPSGK